MNGLPTDRKLITEDDNNKAQRIIATKLSQSPVEDGKIKVPSIEKGKTINVPIMSDADIIQAMKSETVRAAFVMNMAASGISLKKLSDVANRGLDSYKTDKQGEQQPDFIAQLGWWRSIVEVYGIMQQAVNSSTAVPGEQALNLSEMTGEELEKELKKQLGH